MEEIGYQGHYLGKCGLTSEGCSVFVKRDRVDVVETFDLALKDLLSEDDSVFRVSGCL